MFTNNALRLHYTVLFMKLFLFYKIYQIYQTLTKPYISLSYQVLAGGTETAKYFTLSNLVYEKSDEPTSVQSSNPGDDECKLVGVMKFSE